MRARVFRMAENNQGATAVEFAIVLPVLLLFIFGIIEWGLYMYNRQVITNSAREGARYGVIVKMLPRSISDEDQLIRDKVIEFAGSHLVTFGADVLTEEDVTITRDPSSEPFKFGTELNVEFDYMYDFLFLPLDITIQGASTMKME